MDRFIGNIGDKKLLNAKLNVLKPYATTDTEARSVCECIELLLLLP
jgi:hypothetical protein